MSKYISIGRDAGNDLILSSNLASRQHARIEMIGDRFYLTDLGSINGTYLNGNKISSTVEIKPADWVNICDTNYWFDGSSLKNEQGVLLASFGRTPEEGPTLFRTLKAPFQQRETLIITLAVLFLFIAGTLIFLNYFQKEKPFSSDYLAGERESYLSYRIEAHTNLTCAFILFGELMKNPLYTDEWEADLQASMAAVLVICNDIISSNAPSEFRDSHKLLQESAVDYYQAITSFIDLRPEQAKGYLLSGDQKYSASTSLLR